MFDATVAPSDWAELIGFSAILRGKLHELDPEVNEYTVPRVRASAADVAAAEERLGFELDRQHRDLLRCCNGWNSFFTYTDLLATQQLGDSSGATALPRREAGRRGRRREPNQGPDTAG